MPAVVAPQEPAPLRTLSPFDELQAQYVACSYLASACQDALGRFPPPTAGPDDIISQRALELMLAVEWDWRQTLQELAERIAKATSCGAGYNATYAEDPALARQSAPDHGASHRRRPSVRRRL
jgi:hypothetical protein